MVRGRLTVNGEELGEGDGAAVSDEAMLRFAAADAAEFLVLELT